MTEVLGCSPDISVPRIAFNAMFMARGGAANFWRSNVAG
jgi:hypothetical protein